MKILVVGGGGREHAIIKALKKSPLCDEIFCAPGNGGIAKDAVTVDIKATDIEAIREWLFRQTKAGQKVDDRYPKVRF